MLYLRKATSPRVVSMLKGSAIGRQIKGVMERERERDVGQRYTNDTKRRLLMVL